MHTLAVKSVSGVQIRLTDERWRHITIRHPELALDKNRVIEAVKDPDFVEGPSRRTQGSTAVHGLPIRSTLLDSDLP